MEITEKEAKHSDSRSAAAEDGDVYYYTDENDQLPPIPHDAAIS